MKFLKLWICCLLVVLLAACGGGGGSSGVPTGSTNPSNFIVNAPSTLTLPIGQSVTYSINGGLSPYVVTTSAPDVAKVLVNGSELLIAALKKGTTSVVVSPTGGGASYSISVEVVDSSQALQVQAPDAISLIPSNLVEYSISGGSPPYRTTVSNINVATASVQGSTLKIQARTIGSTTIQVFDANNNKVEKSVAVLNSVGPALFATAPASLTMVPGSSNTFSVGGGLPPYSASSSNSTVINANVSGNTLSVSAYSEGNAELVIKDAAGNAVTIAGVVPSSGSVVPLFTNAPASLTLQSTGGARDFAIGGGKAPYSVQSSNSAAVRVSVAGTVLTVTPVSDGTASVTVTDAAGTQKSFNVTVVSGGSGSTTVLFTTAPTTLSISPNTTLTFGIGGGTAPYAVATSNQQVVNASVAGTQLSLSAPAGATGTANVVITDASGGKITVVVTASSAATTTLSLSATSLTLPINIPGSVRIIGGAPPYTVTSGIPSAVSASPSTLATAGEFTLTPLLVSTLDVTVVDSAGQSAKVNVTVNSGTPGIRIAPSALTISETFTNQTINFTLIGQSSGNYTIFSSDVGRIQVVTPVRSDGVVQLATTGALGVTANTDVTITVVDSQNRIATSVITIRDNN